MRVKVPIHLPWRPVPLAIVVGLMVVHFGWVETAFSQAPSPKEGQAIFQQKCIACHFQGSPIAPNLQGVTQRRDPEWLKRYIAAPEKALAEGDPVIVELFNKYNKLPMPNPGLNESEIEAVIAYLETYGTDTAQTTPPAGPSPSLPATFPQGDPAIGKAIFVGAARLKNGGPPCIACHNVSGVGALGGGALGPDLTQVHTRYGGDAGLVSVLNNIPFPTMQPIYGTRKLTPEEQAHLLSFFKNQASSQPTVTLGIVGLSALFVMAGLLLVVPLVWRNRLGSVRRRLVESASREGV